MKENDMMCISSPVLWTFIFQIFLSLINPYIYGNSTDVPVNSSVLNVNLGLCSATNASVKATPVVNETGQAAAPMAAEVLVAKDPDSHLIHNISAKHSSGLLFHPFKIGKIPFTVKFNLYPFWPGDIFEVWNMLMFIFRKKNISNIHLFHFQGVHELWRKYK